MCNMEGEGEGEGEQVHVQHVCDHKCDVSLHGK